MSALSEMKDKLAWAELAVEALRKWDTAYRAEAFECSHDDMHEDLSDLARDLVGSWPEPTRERDRT